MPFAGKKLSWPGLASGAPENTFMPQGPRNRFPLGLRSSTGSTSWTNLPLPACLRRREIPDRRRLGDGVNWLVRFPLSTVLPFSAAVAVAYMIGMVAGFLLYSRWVFPRTTNPLASQIGRFIAVNIAGGVAVIVLAPLLARHLESGGFDQGAAQAIGHGLAIAVGAVINISATSSSPSPSPPQNSAARARMRKSGPGFFAQIWL